MTQLLTDEIGQAFEITEGENSRINGFNTIYTNVNVVKSITNFLSTSFGPCGMDKILQSKDNDITITNDGATILKEMDMSNNPISQLILQLSESQDNEVGDGTTGVVILANALLQHSISLIEKGIHPVRIAENYDMALNMAIEHLNNISELIKNRKQVMKYAARTSLYSKIVSKSIDKFSDICVETILAIADMERKDVDFELINFEKKIGSDVSETELVKGMVIKKEFSHPQMKKEFKKARIALLACPFEPPKLKNKHSLLIKNSEEYKELEKYEKETFLEMIAKLKEAKVDVVLCQWGFDDEANSLLMENNLPAIRWVGGNDLDLIAVHIKANIISRFQDLTPEDCGIADIREVTVGTENEKMVIIENNEHRSAVTIIIRGANDMVIEEARRSLQDGLSAVRNVLINDKVVYGGGSSEMSMSIFLENESKKYEGEEEACIIAFSRALEEIPVCLAKNSGLDALETLTNLRKEQISKKNPYLGVDCLDLKENNMKTLNVFDTLGCKIRQLQMATQLVTMILKINDIIIENK